MSNTISLPPESWAAASAMLDEVLALDEADRGAWLAGLRDKDAAMAEILRRLLQAGDSATRPDILSPGVPRQLLAEALGGAGATLAPGNMIGPYRLIRPIGAGGMATVWLAEQTTAVIRQVALKIPHSGLEAHGSAAHRFERERDLLAALEHEHIARLYDAGVTPQGVLFLAMELIDGKPITEYCDAHRLSIAARLALFRQVLRAVGAAHARLVIHRDLKPSNILVTASGQVKLLDFGIANLLSEPPSSSGRGIEALTPDTASPEQLENRALGTASDVYSLGIVLYELLTGQKPYALDRSSGSLHAVLMATRIRAPGEVPFEASAAAARATTPSRLRRLLRGSLDAIVRKSLERDTGDRYPNVESLAADLTRFERREPVAAMGRDLGYRFQCFLSRRRWPLGVGAVLIAIVSIGVAATLWQARTARDEAARATATRDFLVRVFKASDPRIASDQPRGQITARQLLDSGAAQVNEEFKSQPELQMQMLALLSTLYRELGEQDRYLELQNRRLAFAHQYPGRFTRDEIEVLLNLAGDDDSEGSRGRSARGLLANADALLKQAGLDDSLLRARWWLVQGQSLGGNEISGRAAAFDNALRLFDRYGPHHPGRVTTLSEIGLVAYDTGDQETAIRRYREALTADETTVDRDDAEKQNILGNLINAYMNLGRYDEATVAAQQAAVLARQTYGEHHLDYWVPASEYARVLHLTGRRDDALAQLEQLQRLMPYPPKDPDGWEAVCAQAEILIAEGEAERGRAMAEEVEKNFLIAPQAPNSVRRVRLRLGDAYEQLGRFDDARRTLKASYDEYAMTEAAERQTRMAATERWARFLVARGEAQAARPLFTEVLAEDHGRHLAHTAMARAGLARVALVEGDLASALRDGQAALADWSAVQGFRDVRMGTYIKRVQAGVLLANGRVAQARTLAQEALDESLRFDVATAVSVSEARELLAKAH